MILGTELGWRKSNATSSTYDGNGYVSVVAFDSFGVCSGASSAHIGFFPVVSSSFGEHRSLVFRLLGSSRVLLLRSIATECFTSSFVASHSLVHAPAWYATSIVLFFFCFFFFTLKIARMGRDSCLCFLFFFRRFFFPLSAISLSLSFSL